MVFDGFSTAVATVLLAGALAALVAMHLLRTRPREVPVVTALFWEAAARRQRPRQFAHRLRQLLAFLILAAIAAAIVLATSAAVVGTAGRERRNFAIVLDGGMTMAARTADGATTRFAEAVRVTQRKLAALAPDDRACVIVVDPLPRVVHGWDQPVAGAVRALANLAPSDQPAQWRDALRLANAVLTRRPNPAICAVTDNPLSAPDGAIPSEVIRVAEAADNAAVISVQVAPDAEPGFCRVQVRIGAWGRSDLPVQVEAHLLRAGRSILSAEAVLPPGTTRDLATDRLRADGDTVEVRIAEARGIPADNAARVRLPRQEPLSVAAAADAPDALQFGLAALNCLVQTDAPAPDLVIRDGALPAEDAGLPAIIIVADGPAVEAGAALEFANADGPFADLELRGCTAGAGGSVPPEFAGQPVTPLIVGGDRVLIAWPAGPSPKTLLVSAALFDESASLPRRAAFIALLDRVLELFDLRARGDVVVSANRALRDPAWPLQGTRAGRVTAIAGERTLSDLSQVAPAAAPPVTEAPAAGRSWSQWLLLTAIALVLLDAVLHARGRVA